MKRKTLALIAFLATTSLGIEAGSNTKLLLLEQNTKTLCSELQLEFNNQIELLMKALKLTETGSIKGNYNAVGLSGEIGAYQILPNTWNYWCRKYFKEILPPTKENQDQIVRKRIEELINKNYGIEEIAAVWNSGSSKNWEQKIGYNSKGVYYNVPAYVKKFKKNYMLVNNA